MFEYNTTINASTGYSPYKLVFGLMPTIPSSIYKVNDSDLNYDDNVHQLKIILKEAHETARNNLILSKEKRKEIYDEKSNDWIPMWGDRVLVQMVQTGIGQKLQNPWACINRNLKKAQNWWQKISKGYRLILWLPPFKPYYLSTDHNRSTLNTNNW